MFTVHSVVGNEQALQIFNELAIYGGVDVHLLHELKISAHSSTFFDDQLILPV